MPVTSLHLTVQPPLSESVPVEGTNEDEEEAAAEQVKVDVDLRGSLADTVTQRRAMSVFSSVSASMYNS